MRQSYRIALPLAAVVLVLDQAAKFAVQANLEMWQSIPVIPGFFNLVYVLNKGAAFGFLNDAGIHWQRWFFLTASVCAIGVILWLLRTEQGEGRLGPSALGLILGGAAGNLVDRARVGLVLDFLDFYLGDWHWPAFNVADMGISCGVFLLIASMYTVGRRPDNAPSPEE